MTKLEQLKALKTPQPSVFSLDLAPTRKMAEEIVASEIAALRSEMKQRTKEMLEEFAEKRDESLNAFILALQSSYDEYETMCKEMEGKTASEIKDMEATHRTKFDAIVEHVKTLKPKDGRDGRNGEKGARGATGINGKDGSPDTPDQVMDKANASQIKFPISKIEGLTEELMNIRRNTKGRKMGGGGDVVTAGANVTITRVGGKRSIAASGGGGSNFETPVGTVDGSNTVFTVSNTPAYIIVDGLQKFATAHYTYSLGTITIIDGAPPTSYIRSAY